MTIGVFLLEDQEVVRAGTTLFIEAAGDLAVVGEASTVADALVRLESVRADVALLDVRLPDGDGIEVCREIRSRWPDIACVMFTSFADDDALLAAIMAGASGYVLKGIRGSELAGAIRRVGSGESLLDPASKQQVLERLRHGPVADTSLPSLSTKERKIIDLIALGRTNRQIAAEMHFAEKTIKNYVSALLGKLGFQRRTEAAAYATRLQQRPPAGDRTTDDARGK